ncbi:hypothetical protein BO443_220020 [Burkholderia orbicola]
MAFLPKSVKPANITSASSRYRTLAAAVDKLAQLDAALAAEAAQNGPAEYAPFRHVFAYRLDPDDDFDGWRRPAYALTRYAGAHTQPDGIFVLDGHFSVRVNGHGIAHAFGLHRGQTPEEIWNSTYDLQNESIQRDLQLDPSYCNDYFTTEAKDGLLLLAFLTYGQTRHRYVRLAGQLGQMPSKFDRVIRDAFA